MNNIQGAWQHRLASRSPAAQTSICYSLVRTMSVIQAKL